MLANRAARPRLSPAQRAVLEQMAEGAFLVATPWSPAFRLHGPEWCITATRPTADALSRRGWIAVIEPHGLVLTYRITPAGRAALVEEGG